MAFSTRYGGHLVQGGKDYFVKGINKEGKERYFALSFVESATDYWKRIS
jgi:riboflavin synthase alpha subunit